MYAFAVQNISAVATDSSSKSISTVLKALLQYWNVIVQYLKALVQ